MTFFERYSECCKTKGVHPSSQASADKLGCSRTNITLFAKSGITPKGDIVAGAARYLNVSSDYLLGLIDAPRPIEEASFGEEYELLELIREMNADGKAAAKAMIYGLLSQEIFRRSNDVS